MGRDTHGHRMEAQDRVFCERTFHDRQAEERAASYRHDPDWLIVRESQYLDHEPWIGPALASLGDLRGRRVLDYGCGHGMAAVVLCKRGATVAAFDLSGGYVREARARALANGAAVDLVQANGECLPFADDSFDCVWGNAVLHHLDLGRAGRELRRVLKPGGQAVFCEPWGGNRVLNWTRKHVHYAGKQRTPDETPLTRAELEKLRDIFPRVTVTGYQLLSMVARVWGPGAIIKALAWCDDRLLASLPFLQRWCRYVVITLRK
jgi:SAM-dependent methyltransferase